MTQRSEAVPLLFEAAQDSDAATRLVALAALASVSSPQVLPVLERACNDVDAGVRAAAIGFLASRPHVDATAVLVHLLKGAPLSPQANALATIQQALLVPSAERVEGLLAALASADAELAPRLTSLLARLRRPDATAALFSALKIDNPAARISAATTLAAVGGREALAALRSMAANDASTEVRRVCALLLAQ